MIYLKKNNRLDCNYCKNKLFGNRDTNVLIKEREADINFRQGLCYPSKNWKSMFIKILNIINRNLNENPNSKNMYKQTNKGILEQVAFL